MHLNDAILQDNVFVQMLCSIQYRVVKQNADDAFYELENPREQIQSYVFDGNVPTNSIASASIMYKPINGHFPPLPFTNTCDIVVVRAVVPKMNLDELFEQKGEVAKHVLEELAKVIIYNEVYFSVGVSSI